MDYNYEQIVEPMYGVKRNVLLDMELLSDNILPHKYAIKSWYF